MSKKSPDKTSRFKELGDELKAQDEEHKATLREKAEQLARDIHESNVSHEAWRQDRAAAWQRFAAMCQTVADNANNEMNEAPIYIDFSDGTEPFSEAWATAEFTFLNKSDNGRRGSLHVEMSNQFILKITVWTNKRQYTLRSDAPLRGKSAEETDAGTLEDALLDALRICTITADDSGTMFVGQPKHRSKRSKIPLWDAVKLIFKR
ncbi:hypothetical protein M5E06_24430 [Azospirillum sp. A1-3]|uniref:hypothetical protein n=1 Tax=Azospirillum sp. A1-3 TaxID=185874 RepID=UPI002076E68F|nr:hypothetical protein [Azospirillum sp. A1-3]MCM8737271.1 hypothetical protein [Azospirillum sp. A1-3]